MLLVPLVLVQFVDKSRAAELCDEYEARGAAIRNRLEALGGFVGIVDSTLLQTARADRRVKRITTAAVEATLMAPASQSPAPRHLVRYSHRLNSIVGEVSPGWGTYVYDDEFDGSGVAIYMPDTGVRLSHEEFGDNLDPGADMFGEQPDGRVVSVPPFDLGMDHGTRCASLAGGVLCGVAKGATIVPLRVYDTSKTDAEFLFAFIAAIDYVLVNHSLPTPPIISVSLGFNFYAWPEPEEAPALLAAATEAVEEAVAAGVLFVIAAGNGDEYWAYNFTFPQNTGLGLLCGSLEPDDIPSPRTGFGPHVDIYAYGNVWTAGIESDDDYIPDDPTRDLWGPFPEGGGTSFAAPAVAGAAAILLSRYPDWDAQRVFDFLLNSATRGAFISKSVDRFGEDTCNNRRLFTAGVNGPYQNCYSGTPPAPVVWVGEELVGPEEDL